MAKLVRLYPRNPKRGWYLQTYIHFQRQLKFVGERGWYSVEDDVAKELSKVPQIQEDPRSSCAFMIADDADHAKELELKLLADPKEVEKRVGTFDEPVAFKRPGSSSSTKEESEETKPKSRRRRKAAE